MNLKKNSFHIRKVEFLGYIISEQGMEMSEKEVEQVKTWTVPRTVKNVQKFLEFANFYRRFNQGFAQIAVSLTALTRKDEPCSWTPPCQKAFDMLEQRFNSPPFLAQLDATLPSIIETDASDYAVVAKDSQKQKNGRVPPIAFLSESSPLEK